MLHLYSAVLDSFLEYHIHQSDIITCDCITPQLIAKSSAAFLYVLSKLKNVSVSCSAGNRVSMDVNNNRIEIRFTYLLEADAGSYTCTADLHSSSDPQNTFPERTAQANINVDSESSDEPASCVLCVCMCLYEHFFMCMYLDKMHK